MEAVTERHRSHTEALTLALIGIRAIRGSLRLILISIGAKQVHRTDTRRHESDTNRRRNHTRS